LARVHSEPTGGLDFLHRAGATAGGHDRRQLRGPVRGAVRADPVRDGGRAAGCECVPLVLRLVHAASPPRPRRNVRRNDCPGAGMSTPATQVPVEPLPLPAERRDAAPAWGIFDRIGVVLAWVAGITLCLIAAAIVIYMLFRGLQYVNLHLIVTHPEVGLDQSKTGGFLDPIIGTVILTVLGTAIALPVGGASAVWLCQYGGPPR